MSAFSNAGQQTRGLSAGDWTRLQRLRGAKTSGNNAGGDLVTNADINPTEAAQYPYSKSFLIPYQAAGISKTLRPASKWTDFVASGVADYVTQSKSSTNNAVTLSSTKLCTCATTTLNTKTGICYGCKAFHGASGATRTVYTGPNLARLGFLYYYN